MARYPIKLLKDENRQPFFPFTILESVLVNGSEKNLADVLNEKVVHYSVLPEPTIDLLGQIVQYVGLSDAVYTNGYFYKCVSDGAVEPTYSWENVLVQFQPTRTSHLINDTDFINHNVNNLTYYTLGVETGSTIELAINSSTYVMTLTLKNKAGTVISTSTIDFPIESMVVNAVYDNTNKKIIITLQNGTTVDVPLGDLIAGLQNEITAQNKLNADLVDDTNTTNKFVTANDITNWNNKITQYNVMPTADNTYLDKIVQYTGVTNNSYINSYFYKCMSDGQTPATYYWKQTNVQETMQSGKFLTSGQQNNNNDFIITELKPGVYTFNESAGSGYERNLVYKWDPNAAPSAVQNTTQANVGSKLLLIVFKTLDDIPDTDAYIPMMYLISCANEDNATGQWIGRTLEVNKNTQVVRSSSVEQHTETYFLTKAAQLIQGVKTFDSIPKQGLTYQSGSYVLLPPTQNAEFTNKKYVDDAIANDIPTATSTQIQALFSTEGGE